MVDATVEQVEAVKGALNILWKIIGVVLVFWMHCGFSLLEAGSIRQKNVQNILFKNILNVVLTTLLWWLWGYAFAYGGDSGLIMGGKEQYVGMVDESDMIDWTFQWAFAATAVTIISGGMAERANSYGYICLIIWFQLMVYPFICHWVWGDGWLQVNGFSDFAGSAVVHMSGGFASLVGCIFIGRRQGTPECHNVVYVVIGTFILWMGWYGFNGASGNVSEVDEVSMSIMNTTIAASMGGLTVLMWFRVTKGKWLVAELCNGILGGLVAITANCNAVESWAALVIGICAAPFYIGGQKLLSAFKIDDAIGAFPVHGCCGMWGIIATGFFHLDDGWFYGPFGPSMGWQLIGIVAIAGWTMVMTAVIMLILKITGILRVDEDTENLGLDKAFHMDD